MGVRELAARTGLSVATAARAIRRRSPRAPAANRYARAGTRGLSSLGRAIPASPVPTPGGQGADPPGATGCCQRDLGTRLAAHRQFRIPGHRHLCLAPRCGRCLHRPSQRSTPSTGDLKGAPTLSGEYQGESAARVRRWGVRAPSSIVYNTQRERSPFVLRMARCRIAVPMEAKHSRWLSFHEIARYLGVSCDMAHRTFETGKSTTHRVGRLPNFQLPQLFGQIGSGEASSFTRRRTALDTIDRGTSVSLTQMT